MDTAWGNRELMAEMASRRARMYELLIMFFGGVSDAGMVDRLQDPGFRDIIRAFMDTGSKDTKKAAAMVDAYISEMTGRDVGLMVEELSIDRTLLTRAPGESEFKPPYEGLYKKEKSKGGAPLAVKTFYRRAGLLPDDAINESPDYLGLELDFMKTLCRREADGWTADRIPTDTIRLEYEFMTEHLGSWIEAYCDRAAGKAMTDFYRGCLVLMKVIVAGDRDILGKLFENVEK